MFGIVGVVLLQDITYILFLLYDEYMCSATHAM